MSFIYCQSCGTKIEYTIQKPNFCPKCGSAQGAAVQEKQTNPQPDQVIEAIDNDSVPNLSRIEYEISSSRDDDNTIGNIIGKGSIGEIKRKSYVPKHGSAAKDSLELCRSSKPKDIDERA